MNSSSTIDQRATARLPVSTDYRTAAVAVGRKVAVAEILDQSNGGCKIKILSKYKLKEGDEVAISTPQGQYQAKLVRVSTDPYDENLSLIGMQFVTEHQSKINKSNISIGNDPRHSVGGKFDFGFVAIFIAIWLAIGLAFFFFKDQFFDLAGM